MEFGQFSVVSRGISQTGLQNLEDFSVKKWALWVNKNQFLDIVITQWCFMSDFCNVFFILLACVFSKLVDCAPVIFWSGSGEHCWPSETQCCENDDTHNWSDSKAVVYSTTSITFIDWQEITVWCGLSCSFTFQTVDGVIENLFCLSVVDGLDCISSVN